MVLSKSGYEINKKLVDPAKRHLINNSGKYTAGMAGTLLGIELLDSDDREIIESIGQALNAQAAALFPNHSLYPSRGYSSLLDAHILEAMSNSRFHIDRLAALTGDNYAVCQDAVAKEIFSGLDRINHGTVVIDSGVSDADDGSGEWLDVSGVKELFSDAWESLSSDDDDDTDVSALGETLATRREIETTSKKPKVDTNASSDVKEWSNAYL